MASELAGLPGAELVEPGLVALRAGSRSVPALLVAIAGPRLRRLGLAVPLELPAEPELLLFRTLYAEEPEGAYERYNALLRRLGKFARALERERG